MTEQVQIVERMPRKRVPGTKWKDERRLELVRTLALQGAGPTAIAKAIALEFNEPCTRNMIIGVVNRENIAIAEYIRAPGTLRAKSKPRTQGIAQSVGFARQRNDSRATGAVVLTEPEIAPADLEIPLVQRCTLLELSDDKCHWPVGSGSDLFFCGGKTAHRSKYCGWHASVATAGPQRWNGRRS